MKSQRKTCSLLLILAFLIVPFVIAPAIHAIASDPKTDALTFLENVANIDTSKYNITTLNDDYQVIDNTSQNQVRYVLENDNGTIDASCTYNNETLVSYSMSVTSGVLTLAQNFNGDVFVEANATLDRYMSYLGSSRVLAMKDLLNIVSSANSAIITSGNLKLTISSDDLTKSFVWVDAFNGVESLAFELVFYNGYLKTLNDKQALFEIADTTQTINQADAIEIAQNTLQNFSWTMNSNRDIAENITSFTLKEGALQETLSLQARENQTLYPVWRVEMPVDKIFVGNQAITAGSSIIVGVWADTGAISYCHEISYGGVISPLPTPTIEATPEPDNSMTLLMAALAVGTVVFAIMLIITLMIFKRAIKKHVQAKKQAQTN